MANPKSPAWYTQGLTGPTFDQPGIGYVFYVDGTNGLNTNTGLKPDVPVLTITYALSLCVANRNDYIIVMSYPNPPPGAEVWPIVVNKAKVHIIGTVSQASPSPFLNAPADTDCLSLTASNVEIAGLEFSAGATGACISNTGVIWKANIHDNWFCWQDAGQDGIRLSAGTDDAPHWHIWHNWFGNKATRNAIRVTWNSTRTVIEDNVFAGVPTGQVGINVINTLADAIIRANDFKVADAAAGEAISFPATAVDGTLVVGNRAFQGTVAPAFNAYRDLGANHWGINYAGIAAVLPATV